MSMRDFRTEVEIMQFLRMCKENKKAVLPQGNRAMPQLFFSV